MRISDWSSDVCSSDLVGIQQPGFAKRAMDFPVVRFEVVIDEIVLGRIDDTLEHGARFRGQFLAARRRIEVDVDDARVRQHGFLAEEQAARSEEHTSELQSLMRISYAVFCLKKKTKQNN